MKRSFVLALAIVLVVAAAGAQETLAGFKTEFENFAGDLAGALAVNSTIGSNWSDAYIGKFPHFGVGLTTGAAFTSSGGADSIFQAVGATEPDVLTKLSLGLPVPAVGGTFKIGLPFLPMDVGIKGGYVPSSIGTNILGTGVTAQYTNVGLQVRYALLKQNLLLPNISLGASYNYQKGSVTAPTGLSSQSFTTQTDQGTTTITAGAPELALGWQSNVFDFTAQVSKLLLFVVPYAGVGYTLGTSAVTGGVSSTVGTDYVGGVSALNSYLAAHGGPTLSDQGFTFSANANDPVFRVYGGLSLRIVVVDLDTQVIYVPATKALGTSVTARVQL